jgi:hypothetical protein
MAAVSVHAASPSPQRGNARPDPTSAGGTILARREALLRAAGSIDDRGNAAIVKAERQIVADMIALPGCVPEKSIPLRELTAAGDF